MNAALRRLLLLSLPCAALCGAVFAAEGSTSARDQQDSPAFVQVTRDDDRPQRQPIDPGVIAMHAGASCEPLWSQEFGAEPDNEVWALKTFDDGTGPALYVGGWFHRIGGVVANGIAKWDGSSWSALDGGMTNTDWGIRAVFALEVFDDGSGPALYAAGRFTSAGGVEANRIARWDGVSWSPLGSGVTGETSLVDVYALAVFDDGTGPGLYAGGRFGFAGGQVAKNIARWDGHSWSPLSGGVSGSEVWALQVFDDGTGPALYVAGWFLVAHDVVVNHIARWDGSAWWPLGSGIHGSFAYTLCVFDDGTGPALYVGGSFTGAGDVATTGIARWDGTTWSALDEGINGYVFALTIFDDGTGPALIAGGGFTSAGGEFVARIARWDGTAWSPLGSGLNDNNGCALAVFDDGTGPKLVVGGRFTDAGGVPVHHLASWDGQFWSSPSARWPNAPVWSMTEFDDGTGKALYVGGEFTLVGGAPANRMARWDGATWSTLGAGIGGFAAGTRVRALAVFDDGIGPALYAGGTFLSAGSAPAFRIARWDGVSWSAVGGGIPGNSVSALAVFDDGSGPALYAGGDFQIADGVAASRIAKWDGQEWSALGSGMNDEVRALAVFDDGTGPALIAAGSFTSAGGVAVNRIAKWDGASWSPLGEGIAGVVNALTVADLGRGPALYVGGAFSTAGGIATPRVAKWNGTEWSAVGGGLAGGWVYALAAVDDGTGPALIAGGSSLQISGPQSGRVVKWDGSVWSMLGGGTLGGSSASVRALAVTEEEDSGSSLYVGGIFSVDAGAHASHITMWRGCALGAAPCPADISGDGIVDVTDLLAVLSAWGPCANCPEDLNGDDAVDLADLLLLLDAWGECGG